MESIVSKYLVGLVLSVLLIVLSVVYTLTLTLHATDLDKLMILHRLMCLKMVKCYVSNSELLFSETALLHTCKSQSRWCRLPFIPSGWSHADLDPPVLRLPATALLPSFDLRFICPSVDSCLVKTIF